MNECIKKVLFGNQKQSLKQNTAIVNFVEDYLNSAKEGANLSTETKVAYAIETELNFLLNNVPTEWMLSDKLFVQYVVGVEAWEAIAAHVPGRIVRDENAETGKVNFGFVPEQNLDLVVAPSALELANRAQEVVDRSNSVEGRKALSAEDAAWELIRKIVDACPPAERSELPADDALAAILLSESYWKVNS